MGTGPLHMACKSASSHHTIRQKEEQVSICIDIDVHKAGCLSEGKLGRHIP